MRRLPSMLAAFILAANMPQGPAEAQENRPRVASLSGNWPAAGTLTVNLAAVDEVLQSLAPYVRTEQLRESALAASHWQRGRLLAHSAVIVDLQTEEGTEARYVALQLGPKFFLGRGSRFRRLHRARSRLDDKSTIHLSDDGRFEASGLIREQLDHLEPGGQELLEFALKSTDSRKRWFEDALDNPAGLPRDQAFAVALPFQDGLKVLTTMKGVTEFSAHSVLGKVGPDSVVRLAFLRPGASVSIQPLPLGKGHFSVNLPAEWTGQTIADATAVISALNRNKALTKPLMRVNSLTAETVKSLEARQATLREPVNGKARVESGQLLLSMPDGSQLSVNEAVGALDEHRPLPEGWTKLAGRDVILDIGGEALDENLARLLPDLARLDRALPNLRIHYGSGIAGEKERLRGLLDWERVTLANDTTAIDRVGAEWIGEISKEYLGNQPLALGPRIGSVRVLLDHFDGDGKAMEGLRRMALAGEFKGQHLLLGMCDPVRDTVKGFFEFSRLAIKNGALSVTFPDGVRDPRAFLLATDRVLRDPAIRQGATPQELLPAAYEAVRRDLEECSISDSPEEAVRSKFAGSGPDRAAELFFDLPPKDGGKFDATELKETLERMGKDADASGWLPVVIRDEVHDSKPMLTAGGRGFALGAS